MTVSPRADGFGEISLMTSSALPPFNKFPSEGAAVGRLLAGYSTLEIGLMNCVQMALGNLDTVLKSMFGTRGETKRINEAKGLGLSAYKALGLNFDFQTAIDAMRHCLKIRSQYAHWIWWDDKSGQLAFANVEDIAKTKKHVTDLSQLESHHVTAALLDKQEAWFAHVDQYLAWVNHEGRLRAGKLSSTHNPVAKPRELSPPALWV